jgi:hypothetical protein
MAGIGSYTLKISSPENGVITDLANLWDIKPDDTGLYPYQHLLTAENLPKEWCFQVRALATDMQASDWSNKQCATWQLEEPENLPWPPVTEPTVNENTELGAFFLETDDDHQPVLVLSTDLTSTIEDKPQCITPVPECTSATDGSPCLADEQLEFYTCPACDIIKAAMRKSIAATTFMVYRQQQGRDFVQVSPLIENFWCDEGLGKDNSTTYNLLNDPFITIMSIDSGVVSGVTDTAIGEGIRVLFKDRYPFKSGSSIRYKLMSISSSGEPDQVFTSNWLDIP